MGFLILALFLGLIPASIAQRKGKSFVLWWIYDTLMLIVALPYSLIMKADQQAIEDKQLNYGMRKCTYCAEMVKKMPMSVGIVAET